MGKKQYGHLRGEPSHVQKAELCKHNMVRVAIGKQQIAQYFRHVNVGLFATADGSDGTRLLANLGWVIGLAAETERYVHGATQDLRLLHGACRNIQMLCMRGYLWDAQFGGSLDVALALARNTLAAHPYEASRLIDGANYLRHRIETHQVDESDIAGIEFYQEAA